VGITETMNFPGEPAPRATKSSLMPFPPAAETWARTVVVSMLYARSRPSSWRAPATLSQTPQALQRRKLAVHARHKQLNWQSNRTIRDSLNFLSNCSCLIGQSAL
jgi:hypothetical protein